MPVCPSGVGRAGGRGELPLVYSGSTGGPADLLIKRAHEPRGNTCASEQARRPRHSGTARAVPAALAAALGGVHILSLRALLLPALLLPAEHASLQQTADPAAGAQPLASEGVRWREGQGDRRARALWMRVSEATERGNAGRAVTAHRAGLTTWRSRAAGRRGGAGSQRGVQARARVCSHAKQPQSGTLPLRLTLHFCSSLSPRCDEADQD